MQAASGLAFSAFVGLHLANAWLAPLGQVAYDEVQAVLRHAYQGGSPPVSASSLAVESAVVLVPLLAHALSSAALVYDRRRRSSAQRPPAPDQPPSPSLPWHLVLHRYTGYVQ